MRIQNNTRIAKFPRGILGMRPHPSCPRPLFLIPLPSLTQHTRTGIAIESELAHQAILASTARATRVKVTGTRLGGRDRHDAAFFAIHRRGVAPVCLTAFVSQCLSFIFFPPQFDQQALVCSGRVAAEHFQQVFLAADLPISLEPHEVRCRAVQLPSVHPGCPVQSGDLVPSQRAWTDIDFKHRHHRHSPTERH